MSNVEYGKLDFYIARAFSSVYDLSMSSYFFNLRRAIMISLDFLDGVSKKLSRKNCGLAFGLRSQFVAIISGWKKGIL